MYQQSKYQGNIMQATRLDRLDALTYKRLEVLLWS
jgi:hypothetical protein